MAASLAPTAGDRHWTDLNQDAIVLSMLLEYKDDFVEGGVLCDKLDVPRAELLKRIDSLRARGYVIQASGGRGLRGRPRVGRAFGPDQVAQRHRMPGPKAGRPPHRASRRHGADPSRHPRDRLQRLDGNA